MNDDKTLNIDNHDIRKLLEQERNELLGVYIDENLNFAGYISQLCTTAREKVGILVRLRNLILYNAKIMLYKTSILPYLTNCHLVWKLCKSSDSREIDASKSVRCAQYINLKLKRTRNFSLAPSCLHFITGICKTLQY